MASPGPIDADGRSTWARGTDRHELRRALELCWLVSPDDRKVFTTNFGYSYISSFRINGDVLYHGARIRRARRFQETAPQGAERNREQRPERQLDTPDGAYLYQIYGNASKLVGYATRPDGSLKEVTSVAIPYNSPQGLAGF